MTDLGHSSPLADRSFVRLEGSTATPDHAAVAEEVPVAFVFSGRPHVVMLATPADLEDLAIGFTLSEEIVARAADVTRLDVVRHARGVEIQMEISPDATERLAKRTRALAGRTGCGLCGIEAIEQAVRQPRAVSRESRVSAAALWKASESLDARQPVNQETRAVHAAAWCAGDGSLRVVREDVGRHNALDKVLGGLARAGVDASEGFLVVTSRASYELVQKAAVFGVPLLAAVSRPTGLAIRFAEDAGITLVGLLRGRSANVYTHPDRLGA